MEIDPNVTVDDIIKKYARRLLTKLENGGILSHVIRKHILDELNNLSRELSNHKNNQPNDRSM
jgi:hypothetical protein